MLGLRPLVVSLLTVALLGPPAAVSAATADGVLLGRVVGGSQPLATAAVYAYQLANLHIHRASTDAEGNFLFDELPAGLYKIIAFKPGFLPAVVMLNRASSGARQFLQVQLSRELVEAHDLGEDDDFWAIRARIPGDVLRELEGAARLAADSYEFTTEQSRFVARMEAMAGVDEALGFGEAQRAGGKVQVAGNIRDLRVGVSGNFAELASGRRFQAGQPLAEGRAHTVSLDLEASDEARVTLTTLRNHLLTPDLGSGVDLEHHRLSWSQQIGENGRSDFSAQYTVESNFYQNAPILPRGIPDASQTWRIEGSYETDLTERTSLETKLRYRARDYGEDQFPASPAGGLAEQRLDLFSGAGYEVRPSMTVKYGLYSTLRDGSLSLVPRGELLMQLGPLWQARAAASGRVHDEEPELFDFFATFFEDQEACEQVEEFCYEVVLSRDWGEGETVSIGAVHRKFGETVRMYFSRDFFDQYESLYLVPGDVLPELEIGITRRISPRVLTNLRSNVADGGGGVIFGRNARPYENRVRYLVTSLDTQFERTSTGVFLAFHRLEQELTPLFTSRRRRAAPEMEVERLQLMLTQDLDLLHRLASNLAVQLNMEVSRGSLPEQALYDEEDLLKRVMGGIALKF